MTTSGTRPATRPASLIAGSTKTLATSRPPGGVGKTTLLLFFAIHITLGRDLFGHPIKRSGPVVYLTAEDDRGTMVARLRHMCAELKLTTEEVETVRRSVFILDVSGLGFKLTKVDGEVVVSGAGATALVEKLKPIKPAMLFIDPAVSFGVGESRVNDAEQGLIEAGRLIRNEVGCGVLYVHHTGKGGSRKDEASMDQYDGRGGSALAAARGWSTSRSMIAEAGLGNGRCPAGWPIWQRLCLNENDWAPEPNQDLPSAWACSDAAPGLAVSTRATRRVAYAVDAVQATMRKPYEAPYGSTPAKLWRKVRSGATATGYAWPTDALADGGVDPNVGSL